MISPQGEVPPEQVVPELSGEPDYGQQLPASYAVPLLDFLEVGAGVGDNPFLPLLDLREHRAYTGV